MNDGVRGQIVSHGDISLSDSTLISTGAVNTTSVYENEDSGVLIGQSETVGAHGGIDFSAGAVTMQDTNLSTVGGDSQSTGGEILLGDNSTLTAKERAEITTEALVLSQGIARQGEDGTYLPGTSMEETMGLFGDITVGNGSSIENYDMDAQGSIFIGEGAKLTSVTLDAVSVELDSLSITEGEDGIRTVRMTTGAGDQATVSIEQTLRWTMWIFTRKEGISISEAILKLQATTIFPAARWPISGQGTRLAPLETTALPLRGTVSFEGTLKQNAEGDYVLASGEYAEGTYGGNVVIGDNVTLTMTTVAAENTITLGDNVTYQGTEDAPVYHMSAFSDADNSLIRASIIDTDENGNILNGTVTVTERENKITTGRGNTFMNSNAPGRSAAMDISREAPSMHMETSLLEKTTASSAIRQRDPAEPSSPRTILPNP